MVFGTCDRHHSSQIPHVTGAHGMNTDPSHADLCHISLSLSLSVCVCLWRTNKKNIKKTACNGVLVLHTFAQHPSFMSESTEPPVKRQKVDAIPLEYRCSRSASMVDVALTLQHTGADPLLCSIVPMFLERLVGPRTCMD